jgi:hypothetical protein
LREQWLQPRQSRVDCLDDHDPDVERLHILLLAQALIHRQQDVESAGGAPQQLAVLETGPLLFLDRADECLREFETAAFEACSRRRELFSRDLREKRAPCLFEKRDSLLTGDRGEVVEELFQRFALFEIDQERLDRNASPNENRRAAENLRIGMNDLRSIHVLSVLSEKASLPFYQRARETGPHLRFPDRKADLPSPPAV